MNWKTSYCEGVTLKPLKGGVFSFAFPSASGHVNYLLGPDISAKPGQLLTIKYRIKALSGEPKFVSLDSSEGLLPNFRPMLFTGDWYDDNGRWWTTGNNCGDLIGTIGIYPAVTLEFKLKPRLWSNVYGKSGAAPFKKAISDLEHVCLTFGGGNSFGHGVYVKNGRARFELLKYTIK